MEKVKHEIYCIIPEKADVCLLTGDERRELEKLRMGNQRANEWIRGRMAIHRSIQKYCGSASVIPSVLCHIDGSPNIKELEIAVSLSHDGDYFAVAVCEETNARVGIDLCLALHETRAEHILTRCGIYTSTQPATLQWSIIEAVLKLRHVSVISLLDTCISIDWRNNGAIVSGIGQSVYVRFAKENDYHVAWTGE